MAQSLINTLINGIFDIITNLVNIILLPINTLISTLFPTFTSYLSTFNSFISTYINSTLAWFFSILPPLTRGAIIMWWTFVIGYYTISWSYALIIKIFNAIKRIKFW